MKRILSSLLAVAALALAAKGQDIVLVVNPAVTEASVSNEDAKNILLGNKAKWESAGNIKVVLLSEGAVHEKAIQEFTQRTADQFDKFWKKQVFTGKGIMPAQVKTDADVIDYVAKNAGAFGYVAKASVTDKVKVLPVK
jgi:ABC-type phosphate transport system substrate-binding protein